ncbi:PilN domain-containing protein [Salinisphaera sp. USBA-960]|uniref:PilN domain-containing protein n=1 Tax=Salinisphaera orenii TaxID=856731 RepID=UPI000DBE60B4|nr:PilN domain-containing protein [Salifodinibacter halophilus]NNC26884.1 PilN domain-containing protein [Salifodinibacter halophilus]
MSDLIRLNLLDWRGARRQARQQRFFVMLAVAGVLAAVFFGVLPHWYYGRLISAQKSRNDYLQNQINVADQKLHKIKRLKKVRRRIINRMQVIKKLQNARPAIVHYFDQLVATIPDGVYLKTLKQSGDTTTLKGVAKANANISSYMSNLADAKWLTKPRLIVIEHRRVNGKQYSHFTLQVQSIHPTHQPKNANKGDKPSRVAKRGAVERVR